MKPTKAPHRKVCMICGKPSGERICEPCKSKLQAESLHKKLDIEKKR